MLSRPDRVTVISSEGFELKHLGVRALRYCEGNKVATIEAEGGWDNHGNISQMVYLGAKRTWDSPHQNEVISTVERERIHENIAKALLFEDIIPEFR